MTDNIFGSLEEVVGRQISNKAPASMEEAGYNAVMLPFIQSLHENGVEYSMKQASAMTVPDSRDPFTNGMKMAMRDCKLAALSDRTKGAIGGGLAAAGLIGGGYLLKNRKAYASMPRVYKALKDSGEKPGLKTMLVARNMQLGAKHLHDSGSLAWVREPENLQKVAEDIAEAEGAPGRLRRAANFAGRHKKKLIAGAALAGLGGWGYQNREELQNVPKIYRAARAENGDYRPMSRLDALRGTRMWFKDRQSERRMNHYNDRLWDLLDKYHK